MTTLTPSVTITMAQAEAIARVLGPAWEAYEDPRFTSEHARQTRATLQYVGPDTDLQGAYIYGDYSTGKIWAVKHDGKNMIWHKEIADTRIAITGFGADSKGEILICDYQGGGKGERPTATGISGCRFGELLKQTIDSGSHPPSIEHASVQSNYFGDIV